MGQVLQLVLGGLMLGLVYALVAVGFTLFFGVLDVIKFSHGDVLTLGVFTAYSMFLGLNALGIVSPLAQLVLITIGSVALIGLVGAAIARGIVLPLKGAPPLNILLITMMLGTVLREAIRLFFPDGANPKPFPSLLPDDRFNLGSFTLRVDNLILLGAGLVVIFLVQALINRTKVGLAIRAVAQDEETAKVMGINFNLVVYATFAIGSGLAAFAGVIYGLYYNEMNFSMGLLLGVIGFSAAAVGGFGNIYGAIVGGFLFSLLQTAGTFMGSYKDVFAFGMVIVLIGIRPTGFLSEKQTERV
jgi:branched-chain amino acid transport system permease protein